MFLLPKFSYKTSVKILFLLFSTFKKNVFLIDVTTDFLSDIFNHAETFKLIPNVHLFLSYTMTYFFKKIYNLLGYYLSIRLSDCESCNFFWFLTFTPHRFFPKNSRSKLTLQKSEEFLMTLTQNFDSDTNSLSLIRLMHRQKLFMLLNSIYIYSYKIYWIQNQFKT